MHPPQEVEIRPAEAADRLPLALLFAAVAEERDGIGAEPPVDVERRAAAWELDRDAGRGRGGAEVVGEWCFVDESGFGFGELGMMVAAGRRGRGMGTALVAAAIDWARTRGLHKLAH